MAGQPGAELHGGQHGLRARHALLEGVGRHGPGLPAAQLARQAVARHPRWRAASRPRRWPPQRLFSWTETARKTFGGRKLATAGPEEPGFGNWCLATALGTVLRRAHCNHARRGRPLELTGGRPEALTGRCSMSPSGLCATLATMANP